jgi:hypothetical protein
MDGHKWLPEDDGRFSKDMLLEEVADQGKGSFLYLAERRVVFEQYSSTKNISTIMGSLYEKVIIFDEGEPAEEIIERRMKEGVDLSIDVRCNQDNISVFRDFIKMEDNEFITKYFREKFGNMIDEEFLEQGFYKRNGIFRPMRLYEGLTDGVCEQIDKQVRGETLSVRSLDDRLVKPMYLDR